MVKLVDTQRSGRCTRKGVGVRVPPSAFPIHWRPQSLLNAPFSSSYSLDFVENRWLSFDSPVRFPVKILRIFLSGDIEKQPFKKASDSHPLRLADKKRSLQMRGNTLVAGFFRYFIRKSMRNMKSDNGMKGISIQRSAPLWIVVSDDTQLWGTARAT